MSKYSILGNDRINSAINILRIYPHLVGKLENFIRDPEKRECPFSKNHMLTALDKTCSKYCEKVFPEIKETRYHGPMCPCNYISDDYKEGAKQLILFIKKVLNEYYKETENELDKISERIKSKGEKLEKYTTDGRFGLDDSKVATKLLDKNFSPMIIRKYTRIGFPLYIHMICDANLDDLDNVVHDCIDFCTKKGILQNSIQSLRNFTGVLSESINAHYDKKKRGCVESLGVIFYCDKMIISSLQGDCMNHESCRQELYDCLNLMTKI